MNIDLNRFVENVTVRARVAFVLVIAESILVELENDHKCFALGQEALNLAWTWEEMGDIEGRILAEYVDSPTEKDLGVCELYHEDNEAMVSAAIALTLSIGYVAMYAYRLEKAQHMPEPIAEIGEDTISQIIEFALQTNSIDESYVSRAYYFILGKYRTNTPSELGESISKDKLLAILFNVGNSVQLN
ncbi:MAG: Imm6 family immunity protein [Nostoc sp.]